MSNLKKGSSGPDVVRLQEKLQELGFDPGNIDGIFGLGTEAAVLAFQNSHGLLPDGVVGPRTLHALDLAPTAGLTSVISQVTVPIVSEMFPSASLMNIKTHLPAICQALTDAQLTDKPIVLMALATIRAETDGFEPISEGISRFNTSPNGPPFDRYDNRRDLGNQGSPDGAHFKGQGFIQLTGRFNYQKYSAALDLGTRLIDDPELANDSVIAAKILVRFLADKEGRIREALLAGDLGTARKLVNGGTHGLDHFTDAFRTGERLIPD